MISFSPCLFALDSKEAIRFTVSVFSGLKEGYMFYSIHVPENPGRISVSPVFFWGQRKLYV